MYDFSEIWTLIIGGAKAPTVIYLSGFKWNTWMIYYDKCMLITISIYGSKTLNFFGARVILKMKNPWQMWGVVLKNNIKAIEHYYYEGRSKSYILALWRSYKRFNIWNSGMGLSPNMSTTQILNLFDEVRWYILHSRSSSLHVSTYIINQMYWLDILKIREEN